jgi:putative ABC transport system substrate-binding protein
MTIRIERRRFLAALGGATVAWPHAAHAQQPGRTYRIGLFVGSITDNSAIGPGYPAFRDEMRKRGFTEGQNLIVETRSTRQEASKLYDDAAALVRAKVDLIVAIGPEVGLKAALAASPTLPVVIWANNFDPIERGYVKSLAQPGGNVTGVFTRQPELAAKQLEFLKETFPDKTRVAALWDALTTDQMGGAERAAKSLQMEMHALKLENPPYDIGAAFRRLDQEAPQMLLVLSGPLFGPHQDEIIAQANRRRLPSMFIFRTYVAAGGLMSYGIDVRTSFRRIAEYVAKILNGARSADLPVEQPTKFELFVNLKTAKAIGVELPTSLLLRADEVIE